MKTTFILVAWAALWSSVRAQTVSRIADTSAARPGIQTRTLHRPAGRSHLSLESDPAFWVGTAGNGPAFDANLNFRLSPAPQWRFGVLVYSGTWAESYAKDLLLTSDFKENWNVQWRGAGLETQYQIRFGGTRGGLQPGMRLQWNQFNYQQQGATLATADHFVVTPQVGYQWFPFSRLGLYLLPWTGVQVPVAGTDKVIIDGRNYATRRALFVATAHIGWEFSF